MSRRNISLILIVSMLLSVLSCGLGVVTATAAEDSGGSARAAEKFTSISFTVGATERDRNVTWRYPSSSGKVEFAVKDENGKVGVFKTAVAATAAEGETFIHRAKLKGLTPNSVYVYRLVNGKSVSKTYEFRTDAEDRFNIIFVGDAQIGASGNADNDAANWKKTIEAATGLFPNSAFLISAGDQVDSAGNDKQYNAFLSPSAMTSLAFAPTIGNHDSYKDHFTRYFTLPNRSVGGYTYGNTDAGSDYWYRYNNALFIHLNDNNLSAAEHKVIIDRALKSNPDVDWRIIVMHQSLFSGGGNHEKPFMMNTRAQLVPLFVQYDIDVVLSGHDHVYSRSHIMTDGYTVNPSNEKTVTDPEGIFYLTGGSSSGSKYYNKLDDARIPHAAKTVVNTMAFTNIEIDHNSFAITTYRTDDSSVIDSFKIIKNNVKKKQANIAFNRDYTAPKAQNEADALLNDGMAICKYQNEKDWYAVSDKINAFDGIAQIDFDLGTARDISSVRIHLLGGAKSKLMSEKYGTPDGIELFTSTNGKEFTKVGDFSIAAPTSVPTAYWTEVNKNVNARYVRVKLILPKGQRILLNELEILSGTNNAPLPEQSEKRENVALNKGYESSTVHTSYPDESASTLTDGVITSKNSKFSDTAWAGFNKQAADYRENGYSFITVDLGSVHSVDRFNAYFATRLQDAGIKAPTLLEIYLSTDNVDYTLVGSCIPYDTVESLTTTATVKLGSEHTARYVQFRISSEFSNWMMVSEVEIFGREKINLPGDVTDDGELDKYDLLLIRRHILGVSPLGVHTADSADIRQDGSVDKYDYVILKRKIL